MRNECRRIACLVFALALLPSCSIFAGSTSTSLALPAADSSLAGELQLVPVLSSPAVYALHGGTLSDQTLHSFLTGIQDCAAKGKRASAVATTRQLLVGLKDLQINRQEQLAIADNNVLVSSISASLEGSPLKIECYTVHRGNCTIDLVAWAKREPASDTAPLFFPDVARYLEHALPGLLQ